MSVSDNRDSTNEAELPTALPDMPDSDGISREVGILCVHGIGFQTRGETLSQFVDPIVWDLRHAVDDDGCSRAWRLDSHPLFVHVDFVAEVAARFESFRCDARVTGSCPLSTLCADLLGGGKDPDS
jgi:hypothetical protein